jgi:hypothetical protein
MLMLSDASSSAAVIFIASAACNFVKCMSRLYSQEVAASTSCQSTLIVHSLRSRFGLILHVRASFVSSRLASNTRVFRLPATTGSCLSCIALASYPMHYIGSPLASIYHDSRSRHARAPARSPPRAPLHPRHAQGSAPSYVSLETSFVPWAVPRSLCRVPRGGDSSALVQAHHFIHMFSLVSELLPLTQKLVSHRSGGQTAPR